MKESKRIFTDIFKVEEPRQEIAPEKPAPIEPITKEMTEVVFDLTLPISRMESLLQSLADGDLESIVSLVALANSMNQTLQHPFFEDRSRNILEDFSKSAELAQNLHSKDKEEITKQELEDVLAMLSGSAEKFIHEMKEIHGKTNQKANQTSTPNSN